MAPIFDAFWRAAAYCLHPRVIALSFLPLILMAALSFGLGYFFWESAVSAVSDWLQANELVSTALGWLDSVGAGALRNVFGPLIVLALVTPFIVMLSLLCVGLMMTPAMVTLVSERRFPDLERKHGASLMRSAMWSLGSTLLALLALVASMPLWLVPPLVMVLPPLIWGWLTYRVFAYDSLAEHASADERQQLFASHRHHFLAIGVISGFLGALPSLLWASGAMFIAMAPLLVPLAVWVYTLVFAFASLWFSHFALAALQQLRRVAVVSVSEALNTPAAALIDAHTPPDTRNPALPPPT